MSRKDKFNLSPPTLIEHLQSILKQYPPDGQILKELVQNADDAGATEMKFLLDCTQYGTDPQQFHHHEMIQHQGPALYAYNNAKFKDGDWESIGLLNRSLKEKEPLTVGRFGLGFKSVFHITDLPSLIADDAVGFIDPHEHHFKTTEGNRKSCYLWDLHADREMINRLGHQFQPFKIDMFGISEDTFARGSYDNQTLFRFPLRKTPSKLSSTIFTPDDIHELFESLESEGLSILLFLNSLEVIEVYERGNGERERQILCIKIADGCRLNVRQKRREFRLGVESASHASVSMSFPMVIEMMKFANGCKVSTQRKCWAVSLYHAGTEDCYSGRHLMDDLNVKPICGTAVLLYTDEGSKIHPPDFRVPTGRIFCFLPLPEEVESPTGLNVHVNAYFALEQNRRHLKWPSLFTCRDTDKIKEQAGQWNVFLVTKVIPKALINLILHLIELSRNTDKMDASIAIALDKCRQTDDKQLHFAQLIYHVIPNIDTVTSRWKGVEKSFYENMVYENVFYCPQPRSNWVNAFCNEIIFDCDELPKSSADVIKKVLRLNGLYLISVPDNIVRAIGNHSKVAATLTASAFCTYLRKLQNQRIELTDHERFAVLDYLCGQMQNVYTTHLLELKLIPLNNGNWTAFEAKRSSSMIYIPNEENLQRLLPTLNYCFLRQNLSSARKNIFGKLAEHGILNLAYLEPADVIDLLERVVGYSASCEQVVQNNCREITYQWLNEIWAYMTNHDVDFCQPAEKWHLVPTDKSAKQLAAFRKDAPMIAVRTQEMTDICKALSITTVRDLPSGIACHRMVMGNYILEVEEKGALLKAIKKVLNFQSMETLFKNFSLLPDSRKERLQKELRNSLKIGNAEDVAIVRRLPLFRILSCIEPSKRRWDSAENVKIGTNTFSVEIPLTEKVLDLRDNFSKTLAELLKVKLLTAKEILLTYVIPGLKMGKYSDIESVMEAIIAKYETSLLNDVDFLDHVRSVEFINTTSGKFASPAKLYDNHDNTLKELFQAESLIPAGKFGTIKYRDVLRKLGLREIDDVSNADLLLVAGKINVKHHSTPSSTWKAFIKVLNHLAKKEQNLKFLEDLKWVKPIHCGPRSSSSRFPESIYLHVESAKPLDALSNKFAILVGCVRPLVDIKGIESLAEAFGWSSPPPVMDVVRQLEYVTNWFDEEQQIAVCDLVEIRRLCEDIYSYLEKCLAKDSSASESIQSLQDRRCIFIEKCFLKPSKCALQSNLGVDCLPLLCSFPESWTSNYPKFFECIGIRKRFELDDYLQALEDLYNKSIDDDHQEATSANLKQALRILSCVNVVEGVVISRPAYMPDNTGEMRLASELCFSTTDAECANVDLCHPDIDPRLAKFLGAKSREQYILSSHLEGLEFGQKEELVDRIKRILTGYPLNENILKEMVQNAEDAGANKIHFIIDSRCLPDEKVFDERWKLLQRPALCVYNDSPFSEEDVVGIQSLGRGAKANDGSKIGKFGVGFNCVYHLTDTPTFLCHMQDGTRRLCAFDPALKAVSCATKAFPGYMYKNLDELKKIYPDVFMGYLEDIYESFGGTLFRLSLREKASEISDEVMTVKKLRELFEVFKTEMHMCLLFMKNIQEISLIEIGNTNELREIYTARVKLSEKASQKRKRVNENYVRTTAKRSGKSLNELSQNRTQEVYDLMTEDSEGLCQTWKIVHCMGLEVTEAQPLPDSIQKASGNIDFIPRGDLALRISSNQEMDQDLEMDGQLFNFLPLPVSLRLPVHINGCFALDYENRRSLWSESSGGIKSDWNFCLMKNLIAPAYCKLLLEMRPRNDDKEELAVIKDKIYGFEKLFPDYLSQEPVATYVEQMITAVYCYIASQNLELFPVYEKGMRSIKWISLESEPHFDHLSSVIKEDTICHDETAHKPRKVDCMREMLVESGFQLIISSYHMETNFRHAKVEVSATTPESVLEFYKGSELSQMTCQLTETPFKTIDGLCIVLEYIKGHVEKADSFSCLVNSPFLLTDNGLLQVFDTKDPKFLSRYSKLLPQCSDQFINYKTAEILGLEMKRTKSKADAQKRNSDSSEKEENDLCLYKRFDLTHFADMLPGLLPKAQFADKEFCSIGELSNVLRRSSAVAFWQNTGGLSDHLLKNEKEKEPAFWWLKQVWNFFSSEISENAKREKAAMANERAESNRGKEKAAPTVEQKDVLDCLKKWCLLPVTSSKRREHLLPISNSKAVLVFNEMKDRMREDLINTLRNIGIPQPNYSVLFGTLPESQKIYLKDHLFQTKQDASVAVVQALCAGDYKDAVSDLEEKDKDLLLQFLARNGHQWIKNEAIEFTSLTALRSLPIYENFVGERIAVNGSSTYIVPHNVPEEGSKHWTQAHRPQIFLKTVDEATNTMLTTLGCRQLNLQDVYSRFIFESFSLLDDKEIYAHMSFVKENLLRQGQKQFLFICKQLRFLRTAGVTKLLPASLFFDPRHPVFGALEDPENFPSNRYRSKDWLDDLVQFFDLVHEVSIEKSLEYAEKFAGGIHKEDVGKLEIFLKHVASLEEKSFSELCPRLKRIPFVPMARVEPSVANLHRQKGFENNSSSEMCCFKNAVLFRHRYLVWSNHAVLPKLVETIFHGRDDMLKELGVKLLPSLDDVISHLKNVSQAIISRRGISDRNEYETLKTVLKEIFQFLTEETRRQNSKHIPREFPCITAEHQEKFVLIPPSQTIIQIEHDIKPYLYKLPNDFVAFTELLKLWGVAESPTLQHYARVLSAIHAKAQEESLTSDDLDCIKTAMRGFFHNLDKHDCRNDLLSDIRELFLPGEDGKLYNSLTLIVRDNTTFADRLLSMDLNYMAEFRSLSLDMPSEKAIDLLRRLPEHLRPKFVSEHVTEKRTDESETTVDFRNAIELQNKLRGKWFKQGIFRLAKHNVGLWASHENAEMADNELWTAVSTLDKIEIKGLDCIQTYLEYDGERVSGSERDALYLVQDSVVYITEDSFASDSQDELSAMLAEAINKMCCGLLTNVMHFMIAILNCEPKRIGKCLDNMKIRQCDPFQEVFIPTCGDYVPLTMHCFLKQEGWNFKVGKLVAYEISDSIDLVEEIKDEADYIFAEVIERVQDEEGGGGGHLCDTIFLRYRIRVREYEEIEVSGKLLYGFCKSELLPSLPKDIVFSSLDIMSDETQKDPENLDVVRIREQIKSMLDKTRCSYCSSAEARKIVKRLYLEWHPFLNNPSDSELFGQITSYIQEHYKDDEQQLLYFRHYKARADRYRAQASPQVQEQFGTPVTSDSNLPSSEMPDDTDDHAVQPPSMPVSRISYPRPADARRFIRQARHDLDAAINDEGSANPAYEWACYKYHQAAEKALKAVMFLTSSEQLYIHHLGSLYSSPAEIFPNNDTPSILESIRNLEALLPDHAAMRYPNYDRIPHDAFTEERASGACRLAERIVEWAENKIESSTTPD